MAAVDEGAVQSMIDIVKNTMRGTLEVILARGTEEDLYGLLSGLGGYAQYLMKKERERREALIQPTQGPSGGPKLPQQGGHYL